MHASSLPPYSQRGFVGFAGANAHRLADIHHGARLPKQASETFVQRAHREGVDLNEAAPAFGKRKAVLYATCFVNFHSTDIGAATRAVLAKNGVATEVVYPSCCGMPQLEQGDCGAVAA